MRDRDLRGTSLRWSMSPGARSLQCLKRWCEVVMPAFFCPTCTRRPAGFSSSLSRLILFRLYYARYAKLPSVGSSSTHNSPCPRSLGVDTF